MGLFEDSLKDITLWGIMQASRDFSGKPDPYRAAGMDFGAGFTSFEDTMNLGAMLGSQGGF